MQRYTPMILRVVIALLVCLPVSRPAAAEATLFRVFLVDGSSVVSYGELARVHDHVVFSMPVGGPPDTPRLHAVTLSSAAIDWSKTDRHATSTRYLRYLETRAESDYGRLTTEVAAVLNRVAQSTDRAEALALAEQARRTLADWPRTHYGYRQNEVRDIVTLLDQSISQLRGSGGIELSLFSAVEPVPLDEVSTMPSPREQLDQLLRILRLTTDGRDRVALLHSALALLAEGAGIDRAATERLQRTLQRDLRKENETDRRYARVTQQILADAARAAGEARIAEVERVLQRIDKEDSRLGRQRPEVVQAIRHAVQEQLDAARRLRLLRDQWEVRRDSYRRYQRMVGSQIVQFVKAQPAIEAIRRLDGPPPGELARWRSRLVGGADRLERLAVPEYLHSTHQLLIGAWRFAEAATQGRYDAISSGSLATAWEASSAAAGALLMFSRAQQELRALLEPPSLARSD